MNIKQFYIENYPTDELGIELKDDTNFTGLLNELFTNNDIYGYIGVGDSIIRERLFEKLSEILNCSYAVSYTHLTLPTN